MWTQDLFGVNKPIIALLHLRELPGDPFYLPGGDIQDVVEAARAECRALQDGGVDGLLIANEFSRPYQHKADAVTLCAMSYVIGQIRKEIRIPFGVNVVLNPMATIEMAVAIGASFVRNTFTGAYLGESGLTDTDVAAYTRRRAALGRPDLKMLYKVNPESDAYLCERSIETITRSLIFHCFPDGLCVSGSGAGAAADSDLITRVKAVAGEVPVFCNTGCTRDNIAEKLSISDGACVGTAFKAEGKFENRVQKERVEALMAAARGCR